MVWSMIWPLILKRHSSNSPKNKMSVSIYSHCSLLLKLHRNNMYFFYLPLFVWILIATKSFLHSKFLPKQGRIQGYLSRVWVSRGHIWAHHPFKLPPGGFQYYSGFSACLHSIWTSWTRIQLQKNLSCGAFWKKSKIDCFFSYFEVRIFRVVRRSF